MLTSAAAGGLVERAPLAPPADCAPDQPSPQARRDDICVHILTASATLVGVCLTVIGLLRAVHRLHDVSAFAQQLLGVDAVGFLAACVVAYAALRAGDVLRRRHFERYGDVLYLGARGVMTRVCMRGAGEFI